MHGASYISEVYHFYFSCLFLFYELDFNVFAVGCLDL